MGRDWGDDGMKFAVVDHNNSVYPLASAVIGLGHEAANIDPDILLIDHDSPDYYRNIINACPRAKIVLYPHGEPYMFAWDGIWDVNPRTAAYLSSNPGCAEIMKAYGYPNPIHVIGWFRSEQSAFKPAKQLKRVVFAPIHPLNNGYLNKYHRGANIKAYEALLKMPIKLVVRHIGNLPSNGLWAVNGVEFVNGKLDGSTTEADLVVSNVGTYLATTVAQGKPCAAYGQDYPILDGHDDTNLRFSQNWDKYSHILRYPFDIEDGYGALEMAASTEASDWRDKFIGEQFTAERLGDALKCLNIY